MRYVPKIVILWEEMTDELKEEIDKRQKEIDKSGHYLEGEIRGDWIEIKGGEVRDSTRYVFIDGGDNYCYYGEEFEARVYNKLSGRIKEHIVSWEEYIIREVIE